MADVQIDLGATVILGKAEFDRLLARLRALGYTTVGPRVQDGAVTYGPVERLSDLPQGYTSEQDAGRYRLVAAGHPRYFDVTPGPHTWKQYLFPPRTTLFTLRRADRGWTTESRDGIAPRFALIGVRGCELEALHVQDRVFLREDQIDPIYRERRRRLFILAVNCLRPGGTCFCASMGTGPRVGGGFDLALTELDEVFLVEIGSEVGRTLMADLAWESASAFLQHAAAQGCERAARQMGRTVHVEGLPETVMERLEHPRWSDVGKRCLSCGSCTLVCPTCFCWDTQDHSAVKCDQTRRDRVWDSCFNPSYSYQTGGNTRPNVRSRYRQWLAHKVGAWKGQFDTMGCVGCGRCITWCPAGIDITEEIAALQQEVRS